MRKALGCSITAIVQGQLWCLVSIYKGRPLALNSRLPFTHDSFFLELLGVIRYECHYECRFQHLKMMSNLQSITTLFLLLLLSHLVHDYFSIHMVIGVDAGRILDFNITAHVIAQLNSAESYFENLYVRPNGNILISTLSPSATIYTLELSSSPSTLTSSITIPTLDGLLGIDEIMENTFAVVGACFQGLGVLKPNSSALYEIVLPGIDERDGLCWLAPQYRLITQIPEAGGLNGLAVVPRANVTAATDHDATVLIADSTVGRIYRAEIRTGKYEIVIDTPETKIPPGATFAFGVNGLKIHAGFLYWTNTARRSLYRVAIDQHGWPLTSAPGVGQMIETVVEFGDVAAFDDFTIRQDGTLWVCLLRLPLYPSPCSIDCLLVQTDAYRWQIATNVDNKLLASKDNNTLVVPGGDEDWVVAGDTAGRFGRRASDSNILYVVTGGAHLAPIDGRTEGAKVVAIDTAEFIPTW